MTAFPSLAVDELKKLSGPRVSEECAGKTEKSPRPLGLLDPEDGCRQCPWLHGHLLGEGLVLRGLWEANGHGAQSHVDTHTTLFEENQAALKPEGW